jgi:hypothetical protein
MSIFNASTKKIRKPKGVLRTNISDNLIKTITIGDSLFRENRVSYISISYQNTLMKFSKKNFYIDTSILSLISFTKAEEPSSQVIKNYEYFLDQMDSHHSTFVDADFTWIVTSALFLELIGMGQVKTKLKNQVNTKEWEQFIALEHEDATGLFCDVIAKRARSYILTNLPANKVYRQATVEFLRDFRTHAHAHFVSSRIKRWAKNLRETTHYNAFAKAIFLDTVFRYPFINIKEIKKCDRLKAMQLWAGVMGRLCRVYYELRGMGFEYSALGLFAEIHRLGDCFKQPNPDKKKYDALIRTWDDMADADSINYALLGRKGEVVNILTMDKKDDVIRRLKCLSQNLREIASLGFSSEMCPGTITLFSDSLQVTDFLLVEDVIK